MVGSVPPISHTYSHDSAADLRLAFVLNPTFAILEIIGELWTNSVAILSDAVHALSDSLAMGAAWSLERYS
jgi:cobalt-zinc-cadmium efflux system protein